MSISTKTNCGKWRSNFNFLDLLPLYDVIEENATIKTRTAEEKIVNRTEGDAGADIVVGRKFEAQRIALWLRRVQLCTSIFMLGYNLL